MEAFPAFIPLAGRTVLIVGEGEMADGKAALFVGSPARLLRAPLDAAALDEALYRGVDLVFVAATDEAQGAAAAAAARRSGARLVNVVDRPALCDFYTPAIIDRGAVVAAVGTTGSGPVLARRLKALIETVMPVGVDGLAALLRRVQADVRRALPEFDARRRTIEALLDGPAGAAAREGRLDEAEALARALLAGPPGRDAP